MCTVVFYPANDKFYFASIRDESPLREKALAPAFYANNALNYISPIDPSGGGTWVGINELQSIVILLNGGKKMHVPFAKSKISRGIIVKDLLTNEMPLLKWTLLELKDIEPFTLIVWTDNNLFHLVWDGEKKYRSQVSKTEPHIWSSSTLYTKEEKAKREKLFYEWNSNIQEFSEDGLINFFKSYNDPEQGFIMERINSVKSLSITFIESSAIKTEIHYYDLSDMQVYKSTMITMSRNKDLDCPVKF